jgi:hypothetical protein
MSKPSVFLSYSQRDADIAESVESALERLGLYAFMSSRELRPGEDWRKAIHAALKRADALVMLAVSPQTSVSSWMPYEAGMAEALGKRVMVLVPKRYPAEDLPADVTTGQIVDFDPKAPDRAAQDIFKRLDVSDGEISIVRD